MCLRVREKEKGRKVGGGGVGGSKRGKSQKADDREKRADNVAP
jgi:hypothetical protein